MKGRAYNFLFPAFPYQFELADEIIQSYSTGYWQQKMQVLCRLTSKVPHDERFWQNDELGIQLITYAYSCHAFEWLVDHDYQAGLIAGLSMGLYGALYAAECYDFETGAMLMCEAYKTISVIPETKDWGMASIVGLTEPDLQAWIQQGVIITNKNGEASFLLAGKRNLLSEIVNWALDEGAFKAFLLEHSAPYHVPAFKAYCNDFTKLVKNVPLRSPQVTVMSAIDQKYIRLPKEVCDELIRNLYTPLQWYNTQVQIGKVNAADMIEVGPGDNLKKIARLAGLRSRITPVRKIMARYANDAT